MVSLGSQGSRAVCRDGAPKQGERKLKGLLEAAEEAPGSRVPSAPLTRCTVTWVKLTALRRTTHTRWSAVHSPGSSCSPEVRFRRAGHCEGRCRRRPGRQRSPAKQRQNSQVALPKPLAPEVHSGVSTQAQGAGGTDANQVGHNWQPAYSRSPRHGRSGPARGRAVGLGGGLFT